MLLTVDSRPGIWAERGRVSGAWGALRARNPGRLRGKEEGDCSHGPLRGLRWSDGACAGRQGRGRRGLRVKRGLLPLAPDPCKPPTLRSPDTALTALPPVPAPMQLSPVLCASGGAYDLSFPVQEGGPAVPQPQLCAQRSPACTHPCSVLHALQSPESRVPLRGSHSGQ